MGGKPLKCHLVLVSFFFCIFLLQVGYVRWWWRRKVENETNFLFGFVLFNFSNIKLYKKKKMFIIAIFSVVGG